MPAPIRKKINRRYRDVDLDMLVHPHTGDIVGRTDESAINGAIKAIIKTKKGERVFQPDFGSTVYSSLFEPMHDTTRISLEAQIENAINNQEDRVKLHSVIVHAEPDKNGYEVTITYSPINDSNIVELEFFLERLR